MKMNKKVTAIGGLAALAVVGGTWAFFTQNTTIENKLSTKEGSYGSTSVEKFNPGSEWEPGSEVEKTITVKNTGVYPIFARVKMDENWMRENDRLIGWTSESENDAFTTIDTQSQNDGNPKNDTSTVVGKELENITTDSNTADEKWLLGTDGYWYYMTALEGSSKTPELLNSITLSESVDMGKQETTYYYAVTEKDAGEPEENAEGAWTKLDGINSPEDLQKKIQEIAAGNKGKDIYTKVSSGADPEKMGYANADYTLNITTEVVQATPEALAAEWKNMPEAVKDTILGSLSDQPEKTEAEE